jgi:hypothetical protein
MSAYRAADLSAQFPSTFFLLRLEKVLIEPQEMQATSLKKKRARSRKSAVINNSRWVA